MKRFLSVFMILAMLLSFAACAKEPSSAETTDPSTAAAPEETVQQTHSGTEAAAGYIQISYTDDTGAYYYITAYDNGDGTAYVDHQSAVRKVSSFPLSVLDDIAAEAKRAGMDQLNGQSIHEEGNWYASMYIAFADGGYWGADYSGTLPEEFTDAYQKLDAYVTQLMQDVPEYVPQPVVMGDVNAEALAALQEILSNSGIDNLDMFSIADVPMDEFFTMVMGLTKTDGITCGSACGPMMTATAYSCVIATVEDETYIDGVSDDFAAHVEWARWVCVSATNALIARKGNMVLCLASSDALYAKTAAAIRSTGWTIVQELKNPNM